MNKKIIHVVLLLLCSYNVLQAQSLKRKGMLGIMMQNNTDSIASQNQLPISSGVFITSVRPNSTFSELGIKQGDLLTHLNKKEINNIQDVLVITSQMYAGDKISASFYSKNKKLTSSTLLLGRPIENYKNGNVKYGEVEYKDNVLRSILVTPKNIKKAPVVYFLQGFTCGSIEITSENSPMKKLISDWVNAGYAVYRVEKPGVGDSQSKRHCSVISFEEELKGFQEGYKDLLSKSDIDKERIFMFGHSLGGIVAPILNEYKSPKGILVYGTTGKNWYDYMVDLFVKQPKHFGVSEAQIKENNKVNLKFNEDFLLNKLSGDELKKNDDYVRNFAPTLNFDTNQYLGRHFDFWQTLVDVNTPKVWSKVRTNVLGLYGEFDIQAIEPEGTKLLVNYVNQNGGNAVFKLIEKADHGFVNFNSNEEQRSVMNNGSYFNHANHNYSELLGKTTIHWMNSIAK